VHDHLDTRINHDLGGFGGTDIGADELEPVREERGGRLVRRERVDADQPLDAAVLGQSGGQMSAEGTGDAVIRTAASGASVSDSRSAPALM